jgi:hypothetical protein
MEFIQKLNEALPPIIPIKLRNEADYYGISYSIADELKLNRVLRSFAYWTHGWIYAEPITSSREINCWAKPKDIVLVATQKEVDSLRLEGYHNVHAVGMPFIYTKDADVVRHPRSLLVMPAHSGAQSSIETDEEAYILKLLELKSFFSEIVACIHSSCVVNNYWIPSLEKAGIPWILGASVFDRNSLKKMRTIFQSFDYMTTNTIGSHIPYASYCGCKVSIYSYTRFTPESYEKDPWYQKNPDLLWKQYEMCDENVLKQRFPQFFKSPIDATTSQRWANQVLGEENRQSPEAIAHLLGWRWQDQIIGYVKHYSDFILDADRRQIFIEKLYSKIKSDPKYDGFELDIISEKLPEKSV